MFNRALCLYFLFLTATASANTDCIFFIGDGTLLKPVVEERFLNDLTKIKKSWDDCKTSTSLVSQGKGSTVFQSKTTTYLDIDPAIVQKAGTKKNLLDEIERSSSILTKDKKLKIYLGDHGSREGTSATDGILSPDDLRGTIKAASKKGIKVLGVFDHCYSGQMLSSFYDLETNETFGCGLSSGSDDVTFDYSEMYTKGKIDKKTQGSLGFNDSEMLNMMMTTSDRFLVDYVQKFFHDLDTKNCITPELSPLTNKFMTDFVEFNEYLDLFKEIKENSDSYEKAVKKADHLKRSIFTTKHPSYEYADRVDEYYGDLRDAFNKRLEKDPKMAKLVSRSDVLYPAIVACVKIAKVNVENCPGFQEFKKVRLALEAFYQVTKKDIKLKEVWSETKPQYADYTLYDEINYQNDLFEDARKKEIIDEKLSFFAIKKLALEHMMRNKNSAAIKAFRELRTCEKTNSL